MAKILIVEDSPDFANILAYLLKSSDYQTKIMPDGQDAIQHLQRTQIEYDLIITDMIMPNSDGYDLIDYVRAHTKSKIVVLSGGGVLINSENAIAPIKDKVDASYQKPVDTDIFLSGIRALLDEG